jgi:hypothetical protein
VTVNLYLKNLSDVNLIQDQEVYSVTVHERIATASPQTGPKGPEGALARQVAARRDAPPVGRFVRAVVVVVAMPGVEPGPGRFEIRKAAAAEARGQHGAVPQLELARRSGRAVRRWCRRARQRGSSGGCRRRQGLVAA